MAGAFQQNAFQNNAFQTEGGGTIVQAPTAVIRRIVTAIGYCIPIFILIISNAAL